MRRFFFVLCVLLGVALGPLTGSALALPSSLDPAFGTNGVALVDLGSGGDKVVQSAVQPDGGVLAICKDDAGACYLLRYSVSGQLDTGFGVDGSVTLPCRPTNELQSNWAVGHVLFTQPVTGRILVSAAREVLAYTASGQLDTTFGAAGVLTVPTPPTGRTWQIYRFEMASDGSLVAMGFTTTASSSSDVVVMRFTPDGALDPSFGQSGILIKDLLNRSADYPYSVTVDHLGRILVAGQIEQDGFLLRLLPDGTPDATFGVNGLLVPGVPRNVYATVELASGKIVCAQDNGANPGTTALLRLNADGTPDTSFSTISFSVPVSYSVLGDGTAVVAGTVNHGYPTYNDFVLWRYTPEGLPDESFADGGTVSLDFGASDDSGTAIFRPEGRIIVAGSAYVATAGRRSLSRHGTPRVSGQKGIVFQLLGGKRVLKPAVKLFAPTSGPVGSAVTVTGMAFQGATAVTFDGTPAKFVVVSDSRINATVPVGATSGPIAVTNPTGTGRSVTRFTVTLSPKSAKPRIIKLSCTSAKRGALVTITGTGFGAKRGSCWVSFGAKKSTKYVSWSNTRIRCRVPAKAKLGSLKVTVVTKGGTSNARSFKVKR